MIIGENSLFLRRKLICKLLSTAFLMILLSRLDLNVFAISPTATVHSIDELENFPGGFAFFTSAPVTPIMGGSNKAINVFTSGSFYPNCPVTTYTYTGSHYQGWRERPVYSGNNYSGESGSAFTPGNTRTYSLQIHRVGSNPEVDITTLSGNYLRDVCVSDPLHYFTWGETCKIGVAPRSIHTSTLYVTIGSTMSNYPGNYLYWGAYGSSFVYRYLANGEIQSYWAFNSYVTTDY